MSRRCRLARFAPWATLSTLVAALGCTFDYDKARGVSEAAEDSIPTSQAAPAESAKVIYPEIPEHRLHPLGTNLPPPRPPPKPKRIELATQACKTQISQACRKCCGKWGYGAVYVAHRGCECR